jgi:hypothetical protein
MAARKMFVITNAAVDLSVIEEAIFVEIWSATDLNCTLNVNISPRRNNRNEPAPKPDIKPERKRIKPQRNHSVTDTWVLFEIWCCSCGGCSAAGAINRAKSVFPMLFFL